MIEIIMEGFGHNVRLIEDGKPIKGVRSFTIHADCMSVPTLTMTKLLKDSETGVKLRIEKYALIDEQEQGFEEAVKHLKFDLRGNGEGMGGAL